MIARRAPAVLLLLALVAACGQSHREKTLRATYVTLDTVSDGLLVYSREREQVIVAEATSKADGQAKLDKHRAVVDELVRRLIAAYRILAAAAVLDDSKISLTTLTATALALQHAMTELKGTP